MDEKRKSKSTPKKTSKPDNTPVTPPMAIRKLKLVREKGWLNAETGKPLNESDHFQLQSDFKRLNAHLSRWKAIGYRRPATKEDMIIMAAKAKISMKDLFQPDCTLQELELYILGCLEDLHTVRGTGDNSITSPVSSRPNDLIGTRVAIDKFKTSRQTLIRKEKADLIHDYRPEGCAVNASKLYSLAELNRAFGFRK